MATRSTIARYNLADGTVTSIYCHWDGATVGKILKEHYTDSDPRWDGATVGKILKEHYTDPTKLDQLLALGDLSYLAPEVGERHDFDNPTEGWTLAYGRDRGETDVSAQEHTTVGEWITHRKRSDCEYGYLWDAGYWTTYTI
jgi:hypothetical protein